MTAPTTLLHPERMPATAPEHLPDDAPRDEIEQVIADLWLQVLPVGRVGVNDHFYALGGDSLLAAVVACGISDATGVELAPRLALEHPELGRLAEAVRRARRAARSGVMLPDHRRDAHPPVSGRRGPEEAPPWDVRGNVMAVLQMEPLPFQPRAAEQAVRALLQRHGLQPTDSAAGPGRDASLPGLSIRVADLRRHPQARRRRGYLFHRTAAAMATRPLFGTGQRGDRALRVGVVLVTEETWAFILVSHRAMCDSVSMGVLCHELGALYSTACDAREALLPELPESYPELVRPYLRAAWPAPPAGETAPEPVLSGASSSFLLEPGFTSVVRRLAWEEDTGLFTLVAAAYLAVLAHWSGQGRVAVGCLALNRPFSELHGLVGPFASLTVLRSDLSDDPTFRELTRRVRDAVLAAFDPGCSGRPLWEPGDSGRTGAAESLPMLEFRGPSHPLGSLDRVVDTGIAAHPFTLFAAESDDRLCFSLEYDAGRFTHEEIARLGGRLKLFLRGLCANPDRRVSELVAERGSTTRTIRTWSEELQGYSLKLLRRGVPEIDPEGIEQAREPVDDGPVTVLTAVHARSARRLRRFLRALRAQRYAGSLEIVVCDDASPDPVLLQRACEEYGARYVRTGRDRDLPQAMHKCRALNRGLEVAAGRYLLYLDSDILLTPHHVQNCVNLARYHGEGVACNNLRSDLLDLLAWDEWSPRFRFHLSFDRVLRLLECVEAWEPVPSPNLGWDWRKVLGNNLFLSRALADRVGPWDEEYVGYGEEDIDYALRIHRSGGLLVRTSGLPVYHIGHPRQEGDELQGALWAQNILHFFTKHPDTVALRPRLYERVRSYFGDGWPEAALSAESAAPAL